MIEDHVRGKAHAECLHDFVPGGARQGRLDTFLRSVVRDDMSLLTKEACRGFRAKSFSFRVPDKDFIPTCCTGECGASVSPLGNPWWSVGAG